MLQRRKLNMGSLYMFIWCTDQFGNASANMSTNTWHSTNVLTPPLPSCPCNVQCSQPTPNTNNNNMGCGFTHTPIISIYTTLTACMHRWTRYDQDGTTMMRRWNNKHDRGNNKHGNNGNNNGNDGDRDETGMGMTTMMTMTVTGQQGLWWRERDKGTTTMTGKQCQQTTMTAHHGCRPQQQWEDGSFRWNCDGALS